MSISRCTIQFCTIVWTVIEKTQIVLFKCLEFITNITANQFPFVAGPSHQKQRCSVIKLSLLMTLVRDMVLCFTGNVCHSVWQGGSCTYQTHFQTQSVSLLCFESLENANMWISWLFTVVKYCNNNENTGYKRLFITLLICFIHCGIITG